ncbi:MAG TPA: adenylate/guanylate cyclase domain-containing protein [Anaerolineae bacterium]|nr:adenylate/guanylate cyclase domain-containing protein [Anaerolineae bacterium]
MSDEKEKLVAAIAALEGQRDLLGEAVVEAALASMRKQLAELQPVVVTEQRKQVTILFADIKGFTSWAESSDVEDVQTVINQLWQTLDGVILEYGGHIDKHMGDGVMAVWGVQQAREDDALRAVQAGLMMQSRLKRLLNEEKGLPALGMRVGINTGQALLGMVGAKGEYTAIGDAVNVASRLEAAAEVGGVLIGMDTYRQVQGFFELGEGQALQLKGKDEAVLAYPVLGAVARGFVGGSRGVEGVVTKMVGRDEELERLQAGWRVVVAERQLNLMTVAGEAGVGKSRLTHEFQRWLARREGGVFVWQGRAAEQMAGTPYFVWRDALAHFLGIQESDAIGVVRSKWVAGLTAVWPHVSPMKLEVLGAWLGYDFSDSRHVRGLRDDSEQLKDRGEVYLWQLLTALGRQAPVLILLEDIHWADKGSVELVRHLIGGQRRLPLLILASTRVTFFEEHVDWSELGELIQLEPLSEAAHRALLANILRKVEDVPGDLFDLLTTRAAGNPFYLEELVKMLIDDGVIVAEATKWRVVPQKWAAMRVPSSLWGVLQARLERLTSLERTVVGRAAVVGRIFWDEAITVLGAGNVVAALEALEQREIIFQRGGTAFAGTREYLFKHDLLRDVAYESLLKRERRAYHGQIADWLAEVAEANGREDEYAAVIAGHYAQAEQKEGAQPWLARAGQVAARQYAHDEAVNYVSQAIELLPEADDKQLYELLLLRESIFSLQGKHERQDKDLNQLSLVAAKLDSEAQVVVALRRANYAQYRHEYATAAQAAQVAIRQAERLGNKALMADGYRLWGQAMAWRGEYQEAEGKLEVALRLAQEAGDARVLAEVYSGLGTVANSQGRDEEAVTYFTEALRLAEATDQPRLESLTYNNLGITAMRQGHYQRAQAYYEQGLAIARHIGYLAGESFFLSNIGQIASRLGDYERAVAYFEESLWRKEVTGRSTTVLLLYMGYAARQKKIYEEAYQHYQRGLRQAQEAGQRNLCGYFLGQLGALWLAQGEWQRSRYYYEEASSIFTDLGLDEDVIESKSGLAMIAWREGELEEALALIEPVVSYLRIKKKPDFADLYLVYVRCYLILAGGGRGVEANDILAQGYEMLMAQASRLDPLSEKMFKEQAVSNRQLIELWEGRGGR